MSNVRLVVREADRDWSGILSANSVDRVVAALSADPVTLEELETSVERFAKPTHDCRFFANFIPELCDNPFDAGLVVVDLIARLIVVDSTYSSPGLQGNVAYHDGRCCTDVWLRYHLADDWLIAHDRYGWRTVADERRQERNAKPLLDARAVFYGRPMLEFVATEAFAAFANCEETPDAIKRIHASWLLNPRADLGGACPREVALDRHDHISWEMQDRSEYWSILKQCPRGLNESSYAFRLGGFGTHELVMYYELVREVLWSCFHEFHRSSHTESLTPSDYLVNEVSRLEDVRDNWLDTPNLEFHGRSPRSIIDRERCRLPEGVSGREAVVDPDCPCCQMMEDMPGPMFWGLDGSGMDEDFAFDIYHRTRAEWDADQLKWEEFDRKFELEQAERKQLGVVDRNTNSIWSRSMVVGNTADVPLGIRVFGIGCRLAELIVGLRAENTRETTPKEVQQHIDQLNRDFGNLREILQNSGAALAAALIEPVLERFTESLAITAVFRPELKAQYDALSEELQSLLDRPPTEPNFDSGDRDLPF